MKKLKKVGLLSLLSLFFIVLVACSSSENTESGMQSGEISETSNETSGELDDMKTVRYSEVIRSIFYAPHYIAMEKGFFEEEGIQIDMNTAQGSDKGAAALISGNADISLVGPETAIYIYNQEGDTKIKIFHQLTMKDGSFLLSREKIDQFDWKQLEGKTIIGWRPGSAPQMVLNSNLIEKGVEGADVVTNIAATAMAGAFTSGQGDYIQVYEPVASTLINEGNAYLAASLGESFGDFPETSYVATSEYIEQNPDVIQHFIQAVEKGKEWLRSASDEEIVEALSPYFEGTSDQLIMDSIHRYQNQNTWPDNPEMTPEAFEKLQQVLIENGVLELEEKIANMEDVVDMSFVKNLGKE